MSDIPAIHTQVSPSQIFGVTFCIAGTAHTFQACIIRNEAIFAYERRKKQPACRGSELPNLIEQVPLQAEGGSVLSISHAPPRRIFFVIARSLTQWTS